MDYVKNNEESVKRYITEILELASGIVIKESKKAENNETTDSARAFDTYYAVMNSADTYYTYTYTEKELLAAGIDSEYVSTYLADLSKVPYEYQSVLLANRRQSILDEYVEENDYYRMLYGMPNINDRWIYVEDVENVRDDIPIHQLSDDEITIISNNGVLDSLKEEYKTSRYLHHLGDKKINFYSARIADSMSILYSPIDTSDYALSNFKNFYQEFALYSRKVLYNHALALYDYYEAVLIVITLLMTIQRVISDFLSIVITRDFYDNDMIRNFFISYGVDTFDDIPLQYRMSMVKNLNNLQMNTGNLTVVYDICDIFGFNDIDLFKYYLFKEHKRDENGDFIIEFIEETNDNGETELVEDVDSMYDLKFIQTPIDDDSPDKAIADPLNILDYSEVTSTDDYWAVGYDNPDDFKRLVKKEEFNYIETKYISINNMYEMTSLLFEVNYFLRMIQDNNNLININIMVDSLGLDTSITLFESIIALFALNCGKYGFGGEILDTTTQTVTVLGFNFESDIIELKEILSKTQYSNILDEFEYITTTTSSKSLIDIFFKNKGVYRLIKDALAETTSKVEYDLLKKVHDALLLTDLNNDIFTVDGVKSATYLDHLNSINYSLYLSIKSKIDSGNTDTMNEAIKDILSAMEEILSDNRFDFMFMNIPNQTSEYLKSYLYKIIEYFSSYTVTLDRLTTVYIIDEYDLSSIKLLDDMTASKEVYDYSNIGNGYFNTLTDIEKDKVIYKTYIEFDNESLITYK